jgi:hypothetical protein
MSESTATHIMSQDKLSRSYPGPKPPQGNGRRGEKWPAPRIKKKDIPVEKKAP